MTNESQKPSPVVQAVLDAFARLDLVLDQVSLKPNHGAALLSAVNEVKKATQALVDLNSSTPSPISEVEERN